MNSPWDPTPFQFACDWGYESEFATGPEAGTGLQYLQNRYYDPATGRFISPDPLGFLGGSNLYAYADNDPANGVDPSGLAARGRGSGPLQRAGQAIAGAFSFVVGLPGRAFRAVTDRLEGHVRLEPWTPTLANVPLDPSGTGLGTERQAALRAAGGQINQFLENEKQDIANQVFWGVIGGLGGGGATIASGTAGDVRAATLIRYVDQGEAAGEVINELKSLTFTSGVEHALVVLPNGRWAIVSGGSTGISFAEGGVRSILIHTHSYDFAAKGPSNEDFQALRDLGQQSAYLLEHGIPQRYFRR